VPVGRRALPALLTVIAAYADSRGSHALALDTLLGAIPFAAVAALVGFGAYLEDRADTVRGLQALLWALATCLLVLSCAARSPAAQTHSLPPLGRSALVGCLGILVLKAFVAVAPLVRRAALYRPAKP
jgi:peptidoglycan/LPS O-acetylase OafA/YrhL